MTAMHAFAEDLFVQEGFRQLERLRQTGQQPLWDWLTDFPAISKGTYAENMAAICIGLAPYFAPKRRMLIISRDSVERTKARILPEQVMNGKVFLELIASSTERCWHMTMDRDVLMDTLQQSLGSRSFSGSRISYLATAICLAIAEMEAVEDAKYPRITK